MFCCHPQLWEAISMLHALSFISSNQLKCQADQTCCLVHQPVPLLMLNISK